MTWNYYACNFATETQQVKAYNVQPELIDILLIEIIENIWPKVEGDCRVTINKNHRGKNDTCKTRIKVISRITSMIGPQVPKLSTLGTLFEKNRYIKYHNTTG